MRVAVYHSNNDIRLEELEKPGIEKGEILVEVVASGICGTDTMEWYRRKKPPRILGHEISGRVAESKSHNFKAGQRVFVSHHVPCNKCKYCLADNHTACETLHKGNYYPGGYSEYVKVPKANTDIGTYILPDDVSYEEGTMIEPLACAVRGQRVIGVKKGETVLVLGSGVSGLLNIHLAKMKRAKVIATDINKYRMDKAKDFGADQVISADDKLNVKADKVIVCTGAMKAAEQAFECVDRKGIILFFAIPDKDVKIPIVDFWRNEITATSSYGAAHVDLKEALDLIKLRRIDVRNMITHRFPFEKIREGFKVVADAKESLKVVLLLNNS